MEDNLAAEIARIEAELEADRQLREKHQPQHQHHQHHQAQQFGMQNIASAFGSTHAPHHMHHQQPSMQPQQPHVQGGVVTSHAPGQPHHFSKDSDGRSIFVGNLPKGENGGPTSTPEELAQFFADCGPILNCTLLRDRMTGELKGTAYIEFSTYTGMGKAIDMKNNSVFKGNTIIVC